MMLRLPRLTLFCTLAAVAAIFTLQSGCVGPMTTLAYLIKGTMTTPEFKEFKNKRVAVVCRPMVELQYSSSTSANDIAQKLGQLMAANIRKIEIVDPQEVAEFTDENSFEEFTEVGDALDADLVIGIDLEEFGLHQGQTLYQGKARMTVTIYDMEQDGKIVFERNMKQILWPPNSGVPTSERPEDEFRRQFIAKVADQVGWYFYPHDYHTDYAQDSQAGL
jgi:hypothetical protein